MVDGRETGRGCCRCKHPADAIAFGLIPPAHDVVIILAIPVKSDCLARQA